VLARVSFSGGRADGDRRCVVTAGAQGPAGRVVGQDGAVGAQLVDQRGRAGGAGQLSGSAARPAGFAGITGEQDGDSGQVREDLVLADIAVLRPAGIRAGGAGVAVAAPVGGLAVRPA
jgi:hypothetical protein